MFPGSSSRCVLFPSLISLSRPSACVELMLECACTQVYNRKPIPQDLLASIRCPVLILRGGDDHIVCPLEACEMWQRCVPLSLSHTSLVRCFSRSELTLVLPPPLRPSSPSPSPSLRPHPPLPSRSRLLDRSSFVHARGPVMIHAISSAPGLISLSDSNIVNRIILQFVQRSITAGK